MDLSAKDATMLDEAITSNWRLTRLYHLLPSYRGPEESALRWENLATTINRVVPRNRLMRVCNDLFEPKRSLVGELLCRISTAQNVADGPTLIFKALQKHGDRLQPTS